MHSSGNSVFLLNRRQHNRYFIGDISTTHIGRIVDISKGGLKVENRGVAGEAGDKLTFTIADEEVKAAIVWTDKKYSGLKFTGGFTANHIIKNHVRRVGGPGPGPVGSMQDDDIVSVIQKDVLSPCISFMAELESPDANLKKLKIYIEKISSACAEPEDHEENGSGAGEESPGPDTPADLKELLIQRANLAFSSRKVEITDIDFAMARLGIDRVKEISSDFLRHTIHGLEIPLTGFVNYIPFTILKTVIFNTFRHFFNFSDNEGEGSLLLCLETKGINALINLSGDDVKKYHVSATRLYSSISRLWEKNLFSRDLLFINKIYIENNLEFLRGLFDGYILAHLSLNPDYDLTKSIKLKLTKRTMVFSFLAYVSFLAARFIIDRDKDSGCVLISRLKKTGMDSERIMDFLNECISKANDVLKDFGLKDKVRSASLPYSSFKIDTYLLKEPRSRYFIKSLENFSILKSVTRMAVRYEDHAYTHFILSKFLTTDEFGLNNRIFCVIPCANISDDDLYIEDFFYFDLLIFKDIDKIPGRHVKEFIKLWKTFEGKLIVTFSSYGFLDIDRIYLHRFLKDHIVDFPSYYADKAIYERMIEHTAKRIKPFINEREIDKEQYMKGIYSMDYIMNREVSSRP